MSTVEGFTAEIGASGSFQPKHLTFPVTVFFYTLCENSNYASPYLVSRICPHCQSEATTLNPPIALQGHINLGKKGYRIPERGTIQLTLFNPLGTVVKMFVVMYDLTDMPPNSQVRSIIDKRFCTQSVLYKCSSRPSYASARCTCPQTARTPTQTLRSGCDISFISGER